MIKMIKKCFLFLVLIGMNFAFAISCNAQAKGEVVNLVLNPDFESPTDKPWYIWVEDAAAVAVKSVDRKDGGFIIGEQSLLIDIMKRGGGKRVELHQDPFVLKANQKMIYAFWAKVAKDDVRPASMIVNHRADPWTSYGSKAITITDEWTEFWVQANITDNDNNVGIYVELTDTVGKTWFDHFRFYEGKYKQEELIKEEKKAVDPNSKMATTWAEVKQ